MVCKCSENETSSRRASSSANEARKKPRSNSVIPKINRSKSEMGSGSNSHSKSHSTTESKRPQKLRRTRSIDEQDEDNETESEISSSESKSKKKLIRKNSHNSLHNSSNSSRRFKCFPLD